MIFIFTTAICGYAQETNVAEQNDDKTLDSRHQNRRTMRGYKAFYDVEYGFDIDDEEKTGKEVILPAIRTAIIL